MSLTPREQELLDLIREIPLASPEELARRLGTSRSAVNVHVSHLVKKGALLGRGYVVAEPEVGRVVVVGGSNMDFKSRTTAPALQGTSNPGSNRQSAGGVARNIAENLARLGVPTSLISAVGRDTLGERLLHDTEAAGVNVRGVLVLAGESTGTYNAVLDASGELVIAVAEMRVTEQLTPKVLDSGRALLGGGVSWVIADGNLLPATLQELLRRMAGTATRVMFEPVSVPKIVHLLPALEAGLAPYGITPNLAELEALIGRSVPDESQDIVNAAQELHALGIELVWVRRGERGSIICTPTETHILASLPSEVADVTGAGDAMLAAFVAALQAGETLPRAGQLAHAAAAVTVESLLNVVPDLTLDKLRERVAASY